MLVTSEKTGADLAIATRIKIFWTFCLSFVLIIPLILYQLSQADVFVNPPVPAVSSPPTEVQKEIRSWLLNYSDMSHAQDRHNAFHDLTRILQQHEDASKEIEKLVLLNPESTIQLLAVTVGVLSSQGTPEAQQALCNTLQTFRREPEKVMLVLPQIILLENPQDFLFDELQNFIHISHNSILRENAELTLAGLSQNAYLTNQDLAQRITLWLQGKKVMLPKNSEALSAFLDLLGNTANEVFLADILQATTHENAQVRSRAAFALRLFKGDRVVNTLKQLTGDQSSEVKDKSTEALSYFQTQRA
jgi:hypothetical protein